MQIQTIRTIIKRLKDIQIVLLGSLGGFVLFTPMCFLVLDNRKIILLQLIFILINIGLIILIATNIYLLKAKLKDNRTRMCIKKSIM